MVSSLLARCVIVTVGTLYPGYRSYKALINTDLREVVNCLRYWIVFSIFIACETFTDVLLSWFPFYYWIKICLILWIASPTGSSFLFKRFIQPILKQREHEIDRLIEDTRQKGYSALIEFTNKGLKFASNAVLNTAVLGQTYLGEHLKRSLSTSDISSSQTKITKNRPTPLREESEGETDPEFNDRLREDRKFLNKENQKKTSKQNQNLIDENAEIQLDDFEMSRVTARRTRSKNVVETTSNVSKRTTKTTATKRTKAKLNEVHGLSSNETEEEIDQRS